MNVRKGLWVFWSYRVVSVVCMFLMSGQSGVCDGGVQMVIIAAMFKSPTAM